MNTLRKLRNFFEKQQKQKNCEHPSVRYYWEKGNLKKECDLCGKRL